MHKTSDFLLLLLLILLQSCRMSSVCNSSTSERHNSAVLTIQAQRLLRRIFRPIRCHIVSCRKKRIWSTFFATRIWETHSRVAGLLNKSSWGTAAIFTYYWQGLQAYFRRTCWTTDNLAGIYLTFSLTSSPIFTDSIPQWAIAVL